MASKRRIKNFFGSPLFPAGMAVLMELFAAASWLGWPVVSTEHERVLLLLRINAVFFLFVFAAFVRLYAKLIPRVSISFDRSSVKNVQPGNLTQAHEWKYALGITNHSSQVITDCTLVLESAEPHDTSQQRLEVPLNPRGCPNSGGVFSIPPRDEPSVYVEILQELVLKEVQEPAVIRMKFANESDGTPNPFSGASRYMLTFRLQGNIPKPKTFKVQVIYSQTNNRYEVHGLG